MLRVVSERGLLCLGSGAPLEKPTRFREDHVTRGVRAWLAAYSKVKG